MAEQPGLFDRLWLEYRRTGDERVKARLVDAFRPVLLSLVTKVRAQMGSRPNPQDLVNAGVVGLLEAIGRFDPAHGVYFETYCLWRVVGAMHDDQRRFDWAPGSLRLKAQRLRAAEDELTAALARPPSDDEVCEALGTTHRQLAEIRHHADRPASLVPEATSGPPAIADPALLDESRDPERLAAAREARELLLRALEQLPDKQRFVMLLYYFERLKMADIGRVLGLSEARISQLHKQAIETLLRRLGRRRDDFLDALGI